MRVSLLQDTTGQRDQISVEGHPAVSLSDDVGNAFWPYFRGVQTTRR